VQASSRARGTCRHHARDKAASFTVDKVLEMLEENAGSKEPAGACRARHAPVQRGSPALPPPPSAQRWSGPCLWCDDREVPLPRLLDRPVTPGREVESAAPAGLTLHPDAPAQQLDQLGGDGQAQPGAAVLARRRAVGLLERPEDLAQLVRRDADAGVADRKMQFAEIRGSF